LPLYEYKCAKCGHRFEKIESVTASETKKCPKCGGKAERQIAAPAIQFKGSGWYVTDYAGKKAQAGVGENSGEGAKAGEKSGDGKSDSKTTETKTESKPAASDSSSKASAKKKK
jgi:putative FmdB family regulatory protein